ncbi:UDP-4-amino-4,6-dideoxy-N-acetyl-beta-L-altrosamine transaminase [Comamonas serinivorans]|uniref:UDP-4-amino-4, 6-dideoxy-N-acetyl-beta-L-altrosamine transaminase n=1 Tax=Comamonas serinivorans TaxID=1082851 RepID=A0A1Y0ETN9_9BURK|nr:DegT/DnrJ/EryC1/StrS family aminotransferase [Comamonas serinivorans]ARU06946.1 UDP-4-amino-4,6-dideoxy-N-acetyl-beta-L-altrosamine transaminase [Comamonas serinivorans]
MSVSLLPFALPEIGEEEIAEVADSLRSGWLTTGPKTQRFEAEFGAFLTRLDPQQHAPDGDAGQAVAPLHCMAVNSATAGLHLALEALGIGPGDEVITTTHTFTASAEVVRYLGAHPVLVDMDPDSLCIDVDAARRAITPATRAIIPVHFGGRAADMTGILSLAREFGLKVLEDAAHALPCTHAGRAIGTLASDATVFSFYANKTMTTGEGGMVVTRDAALASRVRTMRLHGIDRDAFARFNTHVPAWRYDVVAPGFKYNMTDLAAAIGLHQLKKVARFAARRAEIARQYDAAFADLDLVLPPHALPGDTHSWHLYVIQLGDSVSVSREVFIERMFAQGIGMSVHYIPLHQLSYWKNEYGLVADDFPSSDRAYWRSASLPIYSRMTDADVQRVVAAVRQALA